MVERVDERQHMRTHRPARIGVRGGRGTDRSFIKQDLFSGEPHSGWRAPEIMSRVNGMELRHMQHSTSPWHVQSEGWSPLQQAVENMPAFA